jgi:hypothetical protein
MTLNRLAVIVVMAGWVTHTFELRLLTGIARGQLQSHSLHACVDMPAPKVERLVSGSTLTTAFLVVQPVEQGQA